MEKDVKLLHILKYNFVIMNSNCTTVLLIRFLRHAVIFVYDLHFNKLPSELRDILTCTDLVEQKVLEHSLSSEIHGTTLR